MALVMGIYYHLNACFLLRSLLALNDEGIDIIIMEKNINI